MPTILVSIILAILIITTVFAAVLTIAFHRSQGTVVKPEGMARMVKFCAQQI